MLKSTIHKFYQKLRENKFANRIFEMLEKTPAHALHWYLLLTMALIVVLTSAITAWGTFSSVPADDGGLERARNAATINRADLTSALELYRLKTEEFDVVRQNVPSIIDPGR